MIIPNHTACCAVWVTNWAAHRMMKLRLRKIEEGGAASAFGLTLATWRVRDGIFPPRDKRLHSPLKVRALKKNPPLASETAKANVRAKSDDPPVVTTARMRFPQ